MSRSIICHACGRRLDVEESYKRNKLQCSCGVFCAVPPAQDEKEAFPPAPRQPPPSSPAPLASPDKPAGQRGRVAAEPKAEPARRAGKGLVNCPHCGELIRPLATERGRAASCPNCGSALVVPAAAKKPAPPPARTPDKSTDKHIPDAPPVPPRPKKVVLAPSTDGHDDEDDGNPYIVADTGERQCPECGKLLAPDIVECTGCGYDFEAGQKLEKVYTPVEYHWESGMAPRKRFAWFIGCQFLMVVPCVMVAIAHGSLLLVLGPWFGFALLTSFLFGTWDRLDLTRNRRGRCLLTQTWRYCFIPMRTKSVRIYTYEGVATGTDHEAGCWEWFVFFTLVLTAVIPAIIWWYVAIRRDVFFVALTKDHGFPERMLYRGWDEERMRDIAGTLRDVAELPWGAGADL